MAQPTPKAPAGRLRLRGDWGTMKKLTLVFTLLLITSHLIASSGPVVVGWKPDARAPLYQKVENTWTDYVVSTEEQRKAIVAYLTRIGLENEELEALCREILGRISTNDDQVKVASEIYARWIHPEADDGLPSDFNEVVDSTDGKVSAGRVRTMLSQAKAFVENCIQTVRAH